MVRHICILRTSELSTIFVVFSQLAYLRQLQEHKLMSRRQLHVYLAQRPGMLEKLLRVFHDEGREVVKLEHISLLLSLCGGTTSQRDIQFGIWPSELGLAEDSLTTCVHHLTSMRG